MLTIATLITSFAILAALSITGAVDGAGLFSSVFRLGSLEHIAHLRPGLTVEAMQRHAMQLAAEDADGSPAAPANCAQFVATMMPGANATSLEGGLAGFLGIPSSRVDVAATEPFVNMAGEATSRVTFGFTKANHSAAGVMAEPCTMLDYYLGTVDGAFLMTYFGVARLTSNATEGYRPPGGWTVRLAGGSAATNGRVEVQPHDPAFPDRPFGTVCSFGFDADAALAACAGAGLPTQRATVLRDLPAQSSTDDRPIYMASVDCDVYPVPVSLGNCTYVFNASAHGCTHENDVGVNCDPGPFELELGGGADGVGRLFARNASHISSRAGPVSMFQGVCLDPALMKPTVAVRLCRDLGFNVSSARLLPSYGLAVNAPSDNEPLWSCSDVDGDDRVTSCERVQPSRFGCSAAQTVGLDCRQPPTTPLDDWEFSIGLPAAVPPQDEARGILYVRHDGTGPWGRVCSSTFDDNDALHVCRTLGYNVARAFAMPDQRPNGTLYARSLPLLTDVVCGANASAKLGDCAGIAVPPRSHWRPCATFEAAGVDCRGVAPSSHVPVVSYDAFLVDTSETASQFATRMAQYLAVNASRVTVLGYTQNATMFDSKWVSVVNFTFADPPTTMWYTAASRSDLDYEMSRVSMRATEYVLGLAALYSNASALRPTDTSEFEARIVNINPVEPATLLPSATGLLQVRPSSTAEWGSVCALPDFSTFDATAACRAVGFAGAAVKHGNVVPSHTITIPEGSALHARRADPIYMSNVQCGSAGAAGSLFDCQFTYSETREAPRHDCDHNDDVFLECVLDASDPAPLGTTIVTVATLPFLTFPLLRDRITNATGVPQETIRFAEALSGSRMQLFFVDPEPSVSRVQSINAIYALSQAAIPGVVSITTTPAAAPSVPTSSDWQFRLRAANGSTDPSLLSGLLEVRPNHQSAWGTVCSLGMGIDDSLAACSSVGHRTPTPAVSRDPSFTGQSNQSIYMSELVCSQGASRLSSCGFTYSPPGWPRSACAHAQDAHLDCRDVSLRHNISSWRFRLSNMTAARGRVEVNPYADAHPAGWGTICHHQFGMDDAVAACRSAGFHVSVAYPLSAGQWAGTGPIYMDRVNCTAAARASTEGRPSAGHHDDGGGNTLADCEFDSLNACRHSQDVAVDCTGFLPTSTAPIIVHIATANASQTDPETLQNTLQQFFHVKAERIQMTSLPPGATTPLGTFVVQIQFLDPAPAEFLSAVPRDVLDSQLDALDSHQLGTFGILHLRNNRTSADDVRPKDLEVALRAPWNVTNGLALASRAGAGLVAVRPNASAPWGTVCLSGIDENALLATCRSLGFGDATHPVTDTAALDEFPHFATGPIYLTDVMCNPNAAGLENCSFTFNQGAGSDFFDQCTHARDLWIMCYPDGVNATAFEYRLVDNSLRGNGTGILEVRPNAAAEWGNVCDDFFTTVDANVACRSLGYPPIKPGARYISWLPRFSSQVIYMDDVRCNGTEASLADCPFLYSTPDVPYTDCSHFEDVYLDCRQPNETDPAAWKVRLVQASNDDNPDRGLVELQPAPGMEYGSICGLGFGAEDGLRLCRSLGYDSVPFGMPIPSFGYTFPTRLAENLFMYLSQVNCTGAPGDLLQNCSDFTYSVPGNEWNRGCSRWDSLGVDCSGVARQDAASVLLFTALVNRSVSATWLQTRMAQVFTISQNRTVVQQLTPYPNGTTLVVFLIADPAPARSYMELGRGDIQYFLTAEGPSGLRGAFDFVYLTTNSSAHVRPPGLEFRVAPTTDASPAVGRLEVRPSATAPWGTVCGNGFGNAEAMAACRSVGFSPNVATTWSVPPGNGSIYLSSVDCSTEETYLQNCSYTFSPPGENNNPRACTHLYDVGVDCEGTRPPHWEFRLTRQQSPRIGVVQVRPYNDSDWGTICGGTFGIFGDSFTDRDALSVCRSLGFTTLKSASAVVNLDHITNPLDGPIYITNVDCDEDNFYLQNCTFRFYDNVKRKPTLCTHYQDVTVDCTDSDPSGWELKLDTNHSTSDKRGGLMFRPSSDVPWGGVCSDGFDDAAALAACHSMGFNISDAISVANYGGSGYPYLYGVSCSVNDTKLQTCDFGFATQTSITRQCDASAFVGVDCTGNARAPLPIVVFTATLPSWFIVSTFPTVVGVVVGASASQVKVLNVTTLDDGQRKISWMYGPPDVASLVADTLSSPLGPLTGLANLKSNISATVKKEMRFRLAPLTLITPGQRVVSGRVEVQPYPDAAWGTMCSDGFDAAAARDVCTSLGLVFPEVSWTVAGNQSRSAPPDQIYIDETSCGSATGPYFQNCSFIYSDPAWGRPLHDCKHDQDVVVNCNAGPSGELLQYRLHRRGNDPLGMGVLLGRRATTRPNASWFPFCPSTLLDFGDQACASAGFNTTTSTVFGARVRQTRYAPLIVQSCPSDATFLQNCSVAQLRRSCPSGMVTVLDCRQRDVNRFVVRVLDNSDGGPARRGTLTIKSRYNETQLPNSTFCSSYFSDFDAVRACRSAGYNVSNALAMPFWGAPSTLQPRVQEVDCDLSDAALGECTLLGNSRGGPACNQWAAVGVDCNNAVRPTAQIIGFTLQVTNSRASDFATNMGNLLFVSPPRVLINNNESSATDGYRAISFTFADGDPQSPSYRENVPRSVLQANLLSSSDFMLQLYVGAANLTSNSSNAVRSTMQFRLVPAFGRPSAGVLKVRPDSNSGWGTVCDDGFDNAAARAVCASLGFPTAASAKVLSLSALGQKTGDVGPIYIDDTTCPGDATNFNQCRFEYSEWANPTHNCGHNEDVAVDCAPSAGNWTFRLNSTGYRFGGGRVGTLEAQTTAYGHWGYACGDVQPTAAEFICRSLGFPTTTARTFLAYEQVGQESVTGEAFALSYGNCSSYNGSSTACTFDDSNVATCFPYYSVLGLDCRDLTQLRARVNSTGSRPTRGLANVQMNSSAPWGTICSSGYDDAAALATCKSAGYSVDVAYALPYWGGGSGPIYMSSVLCQPNQNLSQCDFTSMPLYCTHTMDAAVDCSGQKRPAPPTLLWTATGSNTSILLKNLQRWLGIGPSAFNIVSSSTTTVSFTFLNTTDQGGFPASPSYLDSRVSNFGPNTLVFIGATALTSNSSNIVKREMQLRIAPSTLGVAAGIVMVKPSRDEDWGTICASSLFRSRSLAQAAASAVCRTVGFPSGGRLVFPHTLNQTASGAIYLHGLRCPPTARNASDCNFTYSPSENPLHWCTHARDLAVECNTTLPAEAWDFRLEPTNRTALGSAIGTLQARTSPQAPWGDVCGPLYDDNVAKAVCKELGFSGRHGRTAIAAVPPPSATWAVTGMSCLAPDIKDCEILHSTQRARQCSRYDVTVLDCRDLSGIEARLTTDDAGSKNRGLVNVRFTGPAQWGTVCSDGFDDNAALAVCRTAGFQISNAYSLNWWGGGSGPISMTNVLCPSNASSLAACTFASGPPTGCEHWEDVAVDCSGVPRPAMATIMFSANLAQPRQTLANLASALGFAASRIDILIGSTDGLTRWTIAQRSSGRQAPRSSVETSILFLDRGEREALGLPGLTNNFTELIKKTMRLSLRGSRPGSSSGLLMVQPTPTEGVGSVCASSRSAFGADEAIAACHAMGFDQGVVIDRTLFPMASGPIYIDNVICPAGANTFSDCDFVYASPGSGRIQCTHKNDVAIACSAAGASNTASFKATIRDPSTFNESHFIATLAQQIHVPRSNITVERRGTTLIVTVTGQVAVVRADHLTAGEKEALGVTGFSPEAENSNPIHPEDKNTPVFMAVVFGGVAVIGAAVAGSLIARRRRAAASARHGLDEAQAAINDDPTAESSDYIAMESTAADVEEARV